VNVLEKNLYIAENGLMIKMYIAENGLMIKMSPFFYE